MLLYQFKALYYFVDIIDFSLFPNPANKFVKIDLEQLVGQEVDVQIFNNLGVEVKSIHIDHVWSKYKRIDLKDLREGFYTVWIKSPNRKPLAKTFMIGKF